MPAPKVKVEVSSVEARAGATRVNAELRKIVKVVGDINSAVKGVNSSLKSMGVRGGPGKLANEQKRLEVSSKRADAQIRKQNRSLASATEQFKNLRLRIRQAAGDTQLVARLTNSFRALEKRLKSGALSAKAYDKAMINFKKTQGNITRELKVLNAGANVSSKAVGGLGTTFKNLGSSAVFAVGPLSGVGARVTAFSAIATRTGFKIAALTLTVVALGVAAFQLTKKLLNTNIATTRIINTLTVATGSAAKARKEFDFLLNTAQELGTSFEDSALQFAQLTAAAKGSGLTSIQLRKIYVSVSKASVALGLSAEQTGGAFRALQQMMSKGTVQAEELRGQLGERIPGAFNLAAKAMGVTTRELGKMLEQGEVLAVDLLPRLADEFEKTFGAAAALASSNLTAEIEKLKTAFFNLFNEMEKAGGVGKFFAEFLRTVRQNVEIIGALTISPEVAPRRSRRTGVVADVARLETEINIAKRIRNATRREKEKALQGNFFEREFAGRALAGRERKEQAAVEDLNIELAQTLQILTAINEAIAGRAGTEQFQRFRRTGFISTSEELKESNKESLEAIQKAKNENDVLKLRLQGLSKEADALAFRNKLEETYGNELLPKTIKSLTTLATKNREFTEELKKQRKRTTEQDRFTESIAKTAKKVEGEAAVLRLRLQGLDKEADTLAFRNQLEVRYGNLLLPATSKALVKQGTLVLDLEEKWKKQQEAARKAARETLKASKDLASTVAQSVGKISDLVTKLENLRDVQTQLKLGGAEGLLGTQRVGAEAEARTLIGKVPEKELGALLAPLSIDPASIKSKKQLVSVLADILLATKSISDENTNLIKKLRAIPALYDKQLEALVKQEKSLKGSNDVLRLRLQGQKEEADQLEFRNTLEVKFSELSEESLKLLMQRGAINRELTDAWKIQQDAIKAAQKVAQDFASTIAQGFEDAILSANSFKEVLGGVLKTLARVAFNVTVTQPLTKLLTGTFQGFRSHGGSVSGGAPVVVGEEGPEIFTPRTDGVIIPNPRTEEELRRRDRGRERFPRGAGFNALGPNMPTGPRIVDVTSASARLGGQNPASVAGLLASGSPIGLLASAVTGGLFGRFGTLADTENPPQVGTAAFRKEIALGRIASEMNQIGQTTIDPLGLFSARGHPGLRDIPSVMGGDRDFDGRPGGGFEGGSFGGVPFALGGNISAGQRATVGEVGPELFVPSGGGGGRTVIVNQTFDFTGASVEAIALLQQAAAQIKQDVMDAVQIDAAQAGPMSRLSR